MNSDETNVLSQWSLISPCSIWMWSISMLILIHSCSVSMWSLIHPCSIWMWSPSLWLWHIPLQSTELCQDNCPITRKLIKATKRSLTCHWPRANQRPVSRSRDYSWPIRGQYLCHVITDLSLTERRVTSSRQFITTSVFADKIGALQSMNLFNVFVIISLW